MYIEYDGIDAASDHTEPGVYARRLTTYISDPSTVRARTIDEYGRSPSIREIIRMREDYLRSREMRDYGDAIGIEGPPPQPKKPTINPADLKMPERGSTPREVVIAVAQRCNVPHDVLLSPSKSRPVINARFLAAAVLNEKFKAENRPGHAGWLSPIGRALGGRDHSTISHALKVGWPKLREKSPDHLKIFNELVAKFSEAPPTRDHE